MNIKSILITGARSFVALDLARAFYQAGFRVICADSLEKSICRYSSMVSRFYKIASPVSDYEMFVGDLQKIIIEEDIDLLIPTCEEIFYVGKAKETLPTKVFSENFQRLEILHNKWSFYQLLRNYGLATPETHLWMGEQYVGKWILKPVYSRFAAQVQVIEGNWPTWKENRANPLIAQQWTDGEKLCSYTICRDGKIVAHGVYKVLHAMGIGSAICFQSISAPDVDNFIKHFVERYNFTGQIAFDFIRNEKLYCIECNPRATSGVHLFESSQEFIRSFIDSDLFLQPRINHIFHEHLFMLWYGIKQKEIFSSSFWRHFFKGKNPLWMKRDLRVLAFLPIILLDALKQTFFRKKGFHQAMSRDIEYNGEVS